MIHRYKFNMNEDVIENEISQSIDNISKQYGRKMSHRVANTVSNSLRSSLFEDVLYFNSLRHDDISIEITASKSIHTNIYVHILVLMHQYSNYYVYE
jgi:hypothetical protein